MLFNTHSLKLVCNVGGDEQDASERSQKQPDNRDTFWLKVLIIHVRLKQIFTAFVFSLQICIFVLIGVKSLRVTEILLKH